MSISEYEINKLEFEEAMGNLIKDPHGLIEILEFKRVVNNMLYEAFSEEYIKGAIDVLSKAAPVMAIYLFEHWMNQRIHKKASKR